jgi:hypothetical protein
MRRIQDICSIARLVTIVTDPGNAKQLEHVDLSKSLMRKGLWGTAVSRNCHATHGLSNAALLEPTIRCADVCSSWLASRATPRHIERPNNPLTRVTPQEPTDFRPVIQIQ